jgi:diaminohydroxyphosphoribosylaminopyrimidine deaminase/5-amino-6-(5-phosphoribosylamino)uracil reductase
LRGQVDAVLTGIGTVLADDPLLTCRLPGAENSRLVRVVADRHLRLPLASRLVKTASTQPTWVITSTHAIEAAASQATELREAGAALIAVEDEALAPLNILRALGDAGINHVLLEAGPKLFQAFLQARCIDRLYWYRAPMTLGKTGASPIGAVEMAPVSTGTIPLGEDRCDSYELESCLPD